MNTPGTMESPQAKPLGPTANPSQAASVTPPTAARVLLADDYSVLRNGLRALLGSSDRIKLLDEREPVADFGRMLEALKPEVIVLELWMPGMSGLAAVQEMKQRAPQSKIVVLSLHETETYVRTAFQLGADGYVLKSSQPSELLACIDSVLRGRRFISAALSEHIVNRYLDQGSQPRPSHATLEALTRREREILRMIAEGRRNREIAATLYVSVKTVEKHRSNLMNKLDLHNTAALTSFAVESGLVGGADPGLRRLTLNEDFGSARRRNGEPQ
jgi:DNA-binding NarL/FixJ family response regulator